MNQVPQHSGQKIARARRILEIEMQIIDEEVATLLHQASDRAQELLDADPEMKEAFEDLKENDTRFAQNWYMQLEWIYEHSNNYEKAYLRYPIFRITN